jgi:hypothetical protein
MLMPTYQVTVERDGRYWAVRVVELGRWIQARNLREVKTMALDLIADLTGDTPVSVDLDVQIIPPEPVTAHLTRMREFRKQEAEARRQAADELRAAALTLRATGMPLRDVGEILDVSYQRAHQLVAGF